jgi:hypothetical protein
VRFRQATSNTSGHRPHGSAAGRHRWVVIATLALSLLAGTGYGAWADTDPATQAQAVTDVRSDIAGVARAEVGVGEPGCNRYSDPVWGSCAGGRIPWCAMFAKWVWKQAGVGLSLPADNTARGLGAWGAARGLFKRGGPEVGDWVIYGEPSPGTPGGHVDVVVAVQGSGLITVVGGNVSGQVSQRAINPETATGGAGGFPVSGYVEPTKTSSQPAPQWSGQWKEIGGPVTSGLDAASWSARRLDVFGRTASGNLVQKYMANGAWRTATTFPEQVVGEPSATSTGNERLDVFYLGTDSQMHYRFHRGNTNPAWSEPFVPVPGRITSSIDVASWSPQRLDAFARGPAGTLVHAWYEVVNGSGRWRGWEDLGFALIGSPGAVSSEDGRIDVVFRGTDNRLKQIFYQRGSGWSRPQRDLGGALAAGPDIASWGPGRLDVVVQATDGSVRLRTFANGAWSSGYLNLGGSTVLGSGPSIVAWGPNRLDVFARGSGNGLFHRSYS